MSTWEKNVRRVVPYTPGEQPKETKVIKLNTNENPYPPSPMVQKVLQHFQTDIMRKYPDVMSTELVDVLAKRYAVRPEQIFVGVGSDDVLGMAFLTFFASEKPILFADVTYSFYPVWAELFRIPYECPKLDATFHLCKEDYLRENGGIVIANPNAPTSIAVEVDVIEEIVRANPSSVVIVDEAYVDFGAQSALLLVEKYDNLLVVQTFSKSRSMAGMRIGYAIGSEALIAAMQAVKHSYNSYTMSHLAIMCGAAAVRDEAYFQETTAKIMETRAWAEQRFTELGFSLPHSATNFLFVTHPAVPAKELFLRLRERNIFVRYFDKPRLSDYLRVTVGTREEMETLFAALEELLKGYR